MFCTLFPGFFASVNLWNILDDFISLIRSIEQSTNWYRMYAKRWRQYLNGIIITKANEEIMRISECILVFDLHLIHLFVAIESPVRWYFLRSEFVICVKQWILNMSQEEYSEDNHSKRLSATMAMLSETYPIIVYYKKAIACGLPAHFMDLRFPPDKWGRVPIEADTARRCKSFRWRSLNGEKI